MSEYQRLVITGKGWWTDARQRGVAAPPVPWQQAVQEYDAGLAAATRALDAELGALYPGDPTGRVTELLPDPVLARLAAAALDAFMLHVYGTARG